ncbi:hypothetical protein INT47_009785 [Mucor saturninus]|uniref:Uncharacterized protein n=1 Tax=Mucor saturninus TaxID=64648 RepID=A0A8H7UWK7_9FUNG|nr:hypothetical protein INT47_009785 [Mucor saturninus]
MNEHNNSFIGPLLGIKDSVKQLFIEVENKLKRPTISQPENISQAMLPEPTWFTPPQGDTAISRIPKSHGFDSDEVFHSDDNIIQNIHHVTKQTNIDS